MIVKYIKYFLDNEYIVWIPYSYFLLINIKECDVKSLQIGYNFTEFLFHFVYFTFFFIFYPHKNTSNASHISFMKSSFDLNINLNSHWWSVLKKIYECAPVTVAHEEWWIRRLTMFALITPCIWMIFIIGG